MMQVDRIKCRGCGECRTVCPLDAISMTTGQAVIDDETCTTCGACITVCPEGAIRFTRTPAAQTTLAVQPVILPTASEAAPGPNPESRLAWAKPAFSFVGREIIPRLANTLLDALEQRLSGSPRDQRLPVRSSEPKRLSGRRQMRRCRGRRF